MFWAGQKNIYEAFVASHSAMKIVCVKSIEGMVGY